jgi:GTP-binding protein EngB required for normal cell division
VTQARSPAPLCEPPRNPSPQHYGRVGEALDDAAEHLSAERGGQASVLSQRWRERAFVVLITGEFKRGKSTLLNALAGVDLLPTGVLPVTTVPTRVQSGPGAAARVRFRDGGRREIRLDEIRDYVDESRNPGNRLNVATVEVELSLGLPPGVVLVDVPGLGSSHRHNTEAALAALPEADAALVVASVDPPIGEAELRLLEQLRLHAARVDVVLNKIDYLDEEPRRTAEAFTRDVLERHALKDVGLWPVSARAGLAARLAGDDVGWRESGMQSFAESLEGFLVEDREEALARSLARKAGHLVEQELALVDLEIAALRRGAAELRGLVAAFSERRANAERDTAEAVLVFRRRFDLLFGGYADRAGAAWTDKVRPALARRIEEICRHARGRSRSEVWKDLLQASREAVNDFLEGFVPFESDRLRSGYTRLRTEVTDAAAERAEAVWRAAADLLSIQPPRVDPPATPPVPLPAGLQLEPLRLMLEDLEDALAALLPRGLAVRRLAAKALAGADDRYGQAVEQTRDSFVRTYEADFRSLLALFEKASADTAAAVETALRAAESRMRPEEGGSAGPATPEGARRDALLSLLSGLREIEGET